MYGTFNGESLIYFKWNLYGKYYYYVLIWGLFSAFLGCFVTATIAYKGVITMTEDDRNQLLIASIVLGIIHLINEIRQFIQYITLVNGFVILGIILVRFIYLLRILLLLSLHY